MLNKDQGSFAEAQTISGSSYERDRFNQTIQCIFGNCQALILAKNADYTKLNEQDPFFNFRQEAIELYVDNNKLTVDALTMGLLTRLNDKRRRRENLLLTVGRQIITETIEDTILDEMNYLAILLTHLKMHGYTPLEKLPEKETNPLMEELNSAYRSEKFFRDKCETNENAKIELARQLKSKIAEFEEFKKNTAKNVKATLKGTKR